MQQNSKLFNLDNLGMAGHKKMIVPIWRALLTCRQKINFILNVFLEILEGYCKIVILGTLGMPDYAHHQKIYHQLVETFCIYLGVKNQLYPQCLRDTEIIWRYCKDMQTFYFWILWTYLNMQTQYDSSNL